MKACANARVSRRPPRHLKREPSSLDDKQNACPLRTSSTLLLPLHRVFIFGVADARARAGPSCGRPTRARELLNGRGARRLRHGHGRADARAALHAALRHRAGLRLVERGRRGGQRLSRHGARREASSASARTGKGALLYDAAELDVTALVVGRDGALYAGTSPDGKVYRVDADGKAEVYFDPPDKYIWSLARDCATARSPSARATRASSTACARRVRSPKRRCSSTRTRRTSSRSPWTRRGTYRGHRPRRARAARLAARARRSRSSTRRCARFTRSRSRPTARIYALALSDAATGPRPPSHSTQPHREQPRRGAAATRDRHRDDVDDGTAQAAQFGAQPQRRRAAATSCRTRAAQSSASRPTAARTCSGVRRR